MILNNKEDNVFNVLYCLNECVDLNNKFKSLGIAKFKSYPMIYYNIVLNDNDWYIRIYIDHELMELINCEIKGLIINNDFKTLKMIENVFSKLNMLYNRGENYINNRLEEQRKNYIFNKS